MYAIGGSTEKCCLKSVEVYDVVKDSWDQRATMLECRTGHAAVCLPTGVYVMGGFNGKEYLNSVEKYNEDTDTWEPMPPMLEPRARHTAVASSDL